MSLIKTMAVHLYLLTTLFLTKSLGGQAYQPKPTMNIPGANRPLRNLPPLQEAPSYDDINYAVVAFEKIDLRKEKYRHGFGRNIEQSPALVLNADYTPLSHLPLSLWSWQDTLRAVLSGRAIVVSEYSDLWVRSVSCRFRLPSVIALTQYQKTVNKVPVMSRRNVYIRDGFRCQV
jgi:hypothetical protein